MDEIESLDGRVSPSLAVLTDADWDLPLGEKL